MDHLNRPKRGRPKEYDAKKLKKGVEKYFGSISYVATAKDISGEVIQNQLGKPIEYVAYAIPPTLEGLSLFLGIDSRTWRNYRGEQWAADICADAEERIRAWRVGQTSMRDKTQGLQFLLKNDHDMTETVRVEMDKPLTMEDRKRLLDEVRQMMEEDEL
jgi:hypothetical protein